MNEIKQEHLSECSSTQDYLKERIDELNLVSCEKQLAGRGRGSNKWDIFKHSLCFSTLIKPSTEYSLSSLEIGLITSLFFQKEFDINLKLKWPNDLILNNKKVGGILISSHQKQLICGIGINLFLEKDESFSNYKIPAGTIFSSPPTISKKDLAYQLSDYILKNRISNPEIICQQWEEQCFHLHQQVNIYDLNTSTEGQFIGIAKDGSAVLKTDAGHQRVYSGSLKLIT